MLRERKFTLRFILDFYDAFLREPDLRKVSEALNISDKNGQLGIWIKSSKHLKLAKELADERRGKTNSLANYILGNLSSEARKVWDDIEFYIDADAPVTPRGMENLSTSIRKEIFLQALVSCSYNFSKACRIAGINRQTYEAWQTGDLSFHELVKEIQHHKKDYFENALMDLVEQKYPGAVMFVNRTINADRGYNEKLTIEHTGSVGLDISGLDLDLDTKRKILEAIRKKKQQGNVIDAEEVKSLPAPVPVEE